MDEFLLNHPNFLKILAPAATKIGHLSPFFQFFGAEKLVTLGQNWPPFGHWPPPIRALALMQKSIGYLGRFVAPKAPQNFLALLSTRYHKIFEKEACLHRMFDGEPAPPPRKFV